MAALALKTKLPALAVRVIRSPELGIIGVGEGSTAALTDFLHKLCPGAVPKFSRGGAAYVETRFEIRPLGAT
jgi:hypothetical protein